uniref:Uncharacterized protein n=1 Tax=Caenorhabditis japonica TaxID=281687 RepID=A0A8R1II99_CAEJA
MAAHIARVNLQGRKGSEICTIKNVVQRSIPQKFLGFVRRSVCERVGAKFKLTSAPRVDDGARDVHEEIHVLTIIKL